MLNRDLVQQSNPTNYISWTQYLLRFGGFFLSIFLIGTGILRDLPLLIGAGLTLLAGSFFLLWTVQLTTKRFYDADHIRVIEQLFEMSQVQPQDKIAVIDLGLRKPAITVSQYLTTGQVMVIDVFNPQQTSGKPLALARRKAPPFRFDPRLERFDGQIQLLPLPDSTVSAVFLPLILSEFSQHGDRQTLLREVYRILRPNGRLLCAEQKNVMLNWFNLRSDSSSLQPWLYWKELLTTSGFEIIRLKEIHNTTICIRADKPSPYAGKQLSLDLNFTPLS